MEAKKHSGKTISFGVLFLLFLLPLLSACTQETPEMASAKDLVTSYNMELITAVKKADTKPLNDLASEDVVRRVYFWIAAWRDNDLYMDSRLKEIKFKEIAIAGPKAMVSTTEDWEYEYRNINTGKVSLPHTHVSYEMEYILRRRGKGTARKDWIIEEINIKSEKPEESKDKGQP